MNREASETVLVVVQGDAACPLWMNHWGPAPVEDWAMLEQEVHETHAEFKERLGLAVVRFCADTVNPVVLFVASSEADATTWDGATTVLTQLAQRGAGKLLFTRGFGPERRVDAALAGLAEEIAEEWAWSGIEIGVRRHESKVPQLRRASAPPSFPSYQSENRAVAHAV